MKGRGPVVKLDRREKARMIDLIVADFRETETAGLTTLDIGCGNGGISSYFARKNNHASVDIADQRIPPLGDYEFRLTKDETLPFDSEHFDLVISNHVIEHVDDQLKHLTEILRVLSPNGCAYLATPNRSSPIMEGHVGNDRVLKYLSMEPLFRRAGFNVVEYSARVAHNPRAFNGEVAWARYFPLWALQLMRQWFPSHIFILTK